MSEPPGNSPSKYHHIFSHKSLHVGNTKVLGSISSILEDELTERLKNNRWKGLWCNVIFQGIVATKSLSRVIGTRSIHIKIFFASTNQTHL